MVFFIMSSFGICISASDYRPPYGPQAAVSTPVENLVDNEPLVREDDPNVSDNVELVGK